MAKLDPLQLWRCQRCGVRVTASDRAGHLLRHADLEAEFSPAGDWMPEACRTFKRARNLYRRTPLKASPSEGVEPDADGVPDVVG